LEAEFRSRRRVRSNLTQGGQVRESHSDLIRVRRNGVAESEGDSIRGVTVSKRILAEPNALSDGSADSIYLGDKIVNRSSRAMGRPGKGDRHVVCLGFGNSRCDGSRCGQIGSGPGRSAAESAEDSVRIILVVKREFAELDVLSDGSTDAIYLEDQIVSRFGRDGSPWLAWWPRRSSRIRESEW
jgi:hypothetical protein